MNRSLCTFLLLVNLASLSASEIVNEVTQLHPIAVDKVIAPKSLDEIVAAVKSTEGPISIGGARHSQGGQIAEENSLHLDMRDFNRVVAFDPTKKTITVESGITWREIQQIIDPSNLSVSIMQTYANFTVGGSLSVNCHGRYIGEGPIILSVKSIKVVLADGSIVEASPELNSDIFYAVIGGYGGIGVIAEATLQLTENTKVERQDEVMPIGIYKEYFFNNIRNSTNAVFHNADIYPPALDTVRSVTWSVTDKPVTNPERLIGTNKNYWLNPSLISFDSEMPFGKQVREYIVEPLQYLSHPVVWRNHEASYDAAELEPYSRKTSTYVLQEYFVPVDRFDDFHPKMAEILKRNHVNVINISIRHANQDPGSLLAWAKTEVFAFVLYYKQGTTEAEKQAVEVWTRELISGVLSVNGSYYLPYQVHATIDQFQKAYPRFQEFFAIKKRLDPQDKFRNKLWDAYYPAAIAAHKTNAEVPSKFKERFADPKIHDGVYLFLQNVYGLYPEKAFFGLINDEIQKEPDDQAIYEGIQRRIGEVTPFLWTIRRALTALVKQKQVIAAQTESLLGSGVTIHGYAEIGTPGRHVHGLEEFLNIKDPIYIIDNSQPDFSLSNIMERGQLSRIGTFVPMNNYDPIPRDEIPDSSIDLVTIYIGIHHCPPEKRDAFIASIRRILRPGGKLVIRDHDARDATTWNLVDTIHDVFYAGLNKPWAFTSTEQRHFTSTKQLSEYLQSMGFQDSGKRLLQDNDPSLNTLMLFVKSDASTP